MYFKELSIKNFRNYAEITVPFHQNVNIITGENAQGKTNLVEALYFMSLGKSFRTFRDAEMIGFDKEYCKIHALYEKNGQENTLDFTIYPDQKEVKRNGLKLEKNADLLENIYTVIFSPDDLKIVKDEPEKRRKFIDRELCMMDPVYYRALGRYKKALMQRNDLLRDEHPLPDVIDAWNFALAAEGAKVIQKRKEFTERLSKAAAELHRSITQGKECLSLEYECDVKTGENTKEQESIFLEALQKNTEHDLFRRTTTVGPHRDDIRISIDSVDARKFGSQGQQRTAALALKLAEVALIKEETGEDAVLLLDDVLSELDPGRQTFLIQSLSGVQLFITAAEKNATLLESIPSYRLFTVKQGKITDTVDVGCH